MGSQPNTKQSRASASGTWVPVIPLRDNVLFPGVTMTLNVTGEASASAFAASCTESDLLVVKYVGEDKLARVGAIGKIKELAPRSDGSLKLVVEGKNRALSLAYARREDVFQARVVAAPSATRDRAGEGARGRSHRFMRLLVGDLQRYIALLPEAQRQPLGAITRIRDPGRLSDLAAFYMPLPAADKQRLLETSDLQTRVLMLAGLVRAEAEALGLKQKIEGSARERIQKSQREYFLREQVRVIREELGEDEDAQADLADLKQKILNAKMPAEAQEAALKEYRRLSRCTPLSPQYAVHQNYVEWLIALPWHKRTHDKLDIARAQRILDEDHYGLEEPKTRILEYLSVRKLTKNPRSPILCFVGPPGVGKTSLARSVARAMGRKFVRKSLGGVRDEAAIRGHRRTYVGALPGRIIQSIRKAGTRNPVFLLDEVDKLSSDYRGDPTSALLEVHNPEENHSFSDHYIEAEFDLSNVLFICTANTEANVPHVLRDRMEIIRLPGYSELEKVHIAEQFLIPKEIKAHGLGRRRIRFTRPGLRRIVREYTEEVGVRNLQREIAAVCRKLARAAAEGRKDLTRRVTPSVVGHHLGPPRHVRKPVDEEETVGVATGLAYTPYGGVVIAVEGAVRPGRSRLTLTGQLGNVMKESARAAVTYTRMHAGRLGIAPDFHLKHELHIHVPEGAMPKDGPSAGITMAVALISALSGRPVRRRIGLTGEITLNGRVLPIGGLKEKLLAAKREGLAGVILPEANEREMKKMPADLKRGIELTFISHVSAALDQVLAPRAPEPEPRPAQSGRDGEAPVRAVTLPPFSPAAPSV